MWMNRFWLSSPAAYGGDPEASQWVAAVNAGGGSVSAAQSARVAQLIRALKAGGVWTSLDRLWLFASENATQALTDLVARAVATLPVAPAFTANRGYLGDAATAYINLGVAASGLTQGVQDSFHLSFYMRDYDAATTMVVGSVTGGSGFQTLAGQTAANAAIPHINDAGGAAETVVTSGNGHYHIERNSSTVQQITKNGVDMNTTSAVSSSRSSTNLYALARNQAGTADTFAGSRLAAVSLGAALGSPGRANFAAALNTYMTAVGANVY